jgi:phage baseplate assembly protein W
MPISVEDFIKNSPNKNVDIRDMDSIIAPYGDFKELTGVDAVVKSLNTLFLTSEGTYLFDPDFGTGLYKYIFEPADVVTKNAIELEISTALARYETRAKISFEVLFFTDQKGFRINFYISYQGLKRKTSVDIDEQLIKDVV